MASQESLLVGPLGWPSVVARATNAAATATKAAVTNQQHIISGVSISASAAPAAAVVVTLKAGAVIIDEWNLPAAAFAPIVIEFKRPFILDLNTLAELNIPALGAGVIGTAVIRGLTR